ncbi:LLM class F420-dependent oxidoreductase [Candidatus Protofrankia californiensis]|uniref:LLM class F420-dependent oxidoreductase n=1 Tax=Candidatus Protofrankia californiensis TaxID=1839754 RepID=UPI001040F082|nr:LLM class F420-dependent oxidoreductase [Candidatus Protofrankia californiensis]
MDVGLFHINASHDSDPAVVAKRAEELGFESYWLPDHTIIPVDRAVLYPATPPGGEEPEYVFRCADPLIALARASAVTTRLKLGTGICLVAERNPLLLAKQIASLDNMSGGRVLVGIGGGWSPEECTIMGGDFDHRWTQIKDHVAAMKVLWRDDPSEYHGRYVDFPAVRALPKPVQRPHPPLLLGAIANPRSHRRVVEWADGWMPLVQSIDEFAEGVARIKQVAEDSGRDPATIDFTVVGLAGQFRNTEDHRALEKIGCNRVIVWIKAMDNDGMLAEIEELAAELISEPAHEQVQLA